MRPSLTKYARRNAQASKISHPGHEISHPGHGTRASASRSVRRKGSASCPGNRRCAMVVLETIVALPLLVIALMAIIELGTLSSAQSSLLMASRAGADRATQVALTATGVPSEVLEAISAVLDCKGIAWKGVRMEYRSGNGRTVVRMAGAGADPPIQPAPTTGDYVRISVCVANEQLAPNLLKNFCFDLEGKVSQESTTRCL